MEFIYAHLGVAFILACRYYHMGARFHIGAHFSGNVYSLQFNNYVKMAFLIVRQCIEW